MQKPSQFNCWRFFGRDISFDTFSYYEFAQPASDRLTDEAWREMLDQGDKPDIPEWTSSFIMTADAEGLMLELLGKAE